MTAKEYTDCTALWADDVMRFAMRVCPCRSDCEDAVQEAFAALWQHRDDVAPSKGKGYLLSATYRQLMRTFRHSGTAVSLDEGAEMPTCQPDTAFDLREAVERALLTLPEVQRAILQLRDVEGYSYREIGEALALSDDKVQVYLFRARVAMRREMIKLGYDEYKR